MKVVIYESSAHGGNFNYALQLYLAYRNNLRVESASLLIPRNAIEISNASPILLRDRIDSHRYFQRLYFLWRNLINPLILFFYLVRQRKSLVILNDFEQLTAPVWAPLFKIFLREHQFAVFLHDPDRDQYPPSKAYTNFSMKIMMWAMKFGFYHEHLPEKIYYQGKLTQYLSVPHGIYLLPAPDELLRNQLLQFKRKSFLLAIIGHIRPEKNYEMAIQCLTKSNDLTLLLAGSPANSTVDVNGLMQLAENCDVRQRIFWCDRYLSESEMAAAIDTSDCILLNYASSFTSQSGVLNMIAPFRKKVIISDTPSGLSSIVKRFHLGKIIRADSLDALIEGVIQLRDDPSQCDNEWETFIDYASWKNQVEMVLNVCDAHR